MYDYCLHSSADKVYCNVPAMSHVLAMSHVAAIGNANANANGIGDDSWQFR